MTKANSKNLCDSTKAIFSLLRIIDNIVNNYSFTFYEYYNLTKAYFDFNNDSIVKSLNFPL